MNFIFRDFIKGAVITAIFLFFFLFYSELFKLISDIRSVEVVSAVAGGFSAGLFSYLYEKKRRIEEKRTEKYYEHRDALVQIEHELIEARVLMSRNVSSLENAIDVKDRYRLILRFFPLPLTRGLNLKILNLELINKYVQLQSQLDLINSDFEYTKELVVQIRNVLQSPELQNPNSFSQSLLQSLFDSYLELITATHKLCLIADNDIADLIAMCTIAINQENDPLIKIYLNDPKQIVYDFSKKEIEKIKTRKHKEETREGTKERPKPQFVAPCMDVMKVIVPISG